MSRTALLGAAVAFALAACAPDGDAGQGSEANLEAEAPPALEAKPEGEPAPSGVEVPAYTVDDVGGAPKARWSLAGGDVVEAAAADLTVAAGVDRRFRLTAAALREGAKTVVYVEFGRGQYLVEPGVYDCARDEAVVVFVEPDGAKQMTSQSGAPPRACKVYVDQAEDEASAVSVSTRSFRRVVGRIEAELGPREVADAETSALRGAFAMTLIESRF